MLFLILGSIREENGIRWHVCPCCSKEFKKPSDLVRHIRIHTHEKPFKCPQCFRAFAVKSTLTAHIKTHTGIKAFKCQFCMKCFSTSGSLKVHIRLHTGKASKLLFCCVGETLNGKKKVKCLDCRDVYHDIDICQRMNWFWCLVRWT